MVAVTGQSPSPDAPSSLSVLEAVLERITYVGEDTGWSAAWPTLCSTGTTRRARRGSNGYVFHQADNPGIESALRRALGLWFGYPAEFRQLVASAMRSGYSWARPGQDYVNIYDYIRHK